MLAGEECSWGLHHLEAISTQFDREPHMAYLDKLAKVRILC